MNFSSFQLELEIGVAFIWSNEEFAFRFYANETPELN